MAELATLREFIRQHSDVAKRMIQDGNADVMRVVLEDPQFDPSFDDNIAITAASSKGYGDIVVMLLSDPRVNPSAQGNLSIIQASTNGRVDVVRILLDHEGVDPSAGHNAAIRLASSNGHADIVRMLIDIDGVDPSVLNNAALSWACTNNHADVVEILLRDPRVQLDAMTYGDWYVLHRATGAVFPEGVVARSDWSFLNNLPIQGTEFLLQNYFPEFRLWCRGPSGRRTSTGRLKTNFELLNRPIRNLIRRYVHAREHARLRHNVLGHVYDQGFAYDDTMMCGKLWNSAP